MPGPRRPGGRGVARTVDPGRDREGEAPLRVREERQQARRYAMAVTPARTVREAMHEGCECIGESQSLLDAAKRMEELDVGVLPICGDDDRLKGMLTDRDIVVKALAQGRDPATTKCGEF